MMTFWEDWLSWWANTLNPFLKIPNSTLFIMFLTLSLTTISMIVYRIFTDVKQLKENDIEVRRHMRELNEAKRRQDKAALARLERKEDRINSLRTYTTRQRSKVSFITIIPFTLIYFTLSTTLTSAGVVAHSPLTLPFVGTELFFFQWYLVTYFTIHTLLSRLFGITFEITYKSEPPPQPKDKVKKPSRRRRKK